MNPIYQQALDGTLVSPQPGDLITGIVVQNDLPIPINFFWVSYTAELIAVPATGTITPGDTPATIAAGGEWGGPTASLYANTYFVVMSALSGGFVGVFQVDDGVTTYVLNAGMLLAPNAIGTCPQPNSSVVIPSDSPLVVVGVGNVPNGNVVTREQYWAQTPNSYMLAPGQTNTVSYTVTSGTQQTTTAQSTMSAALEVSADAGWGPVSASVSASLNAQSSVMQQVTSTQESTQSYSLVLSNSSQNVQMFLIWQLMDIVTVYGAAAPIASMINAQTPSIVDGPFDPANLPPLVFPEMTDEMMKKIPAPLLRAPRRRRP